VSVALARVFKSDHTKIITPGEGEILWRIFLAVQKTLITTADLERRVETLEERILTIMRMVSEQDSRPGSGALKSGSQSMKPRFTLIDLRHYIIKLQVSRKGFATRARISIRLY
jgi:hypothetical protein